MTTAAITAANFSFLRFNSLNPIKCQLANTPNPGIIIAISFVIKPKIKNTIDKNFRNYSDFLTRCPSQKESHFPQWIKVLEIPSPKKRSQNCLSFTAPGRSGSAKYFSLDDQMP